MSYIEYPFDDFAIHMKELHENHLKSSIHDDDNFFYNIRRIQQYFGEYYPDDGMFPIYTTFTVMLSHVSKCADLYDTERFAIAHGKELYASEALLRGIHWYFTETPRSEWKGDSDIVPLVKEHALKWSDNNG